MPLDKEALKLLLGKAVKISDEAEIYFISKEQLKIDVINRRIESIDELEEAGLSVRLIKNKKLGFAYTADFDNASLDETIELAARNADISAADEHAGFPSPQKQNTMMSLVDPDLATVPLSEKKALALDIEKYALEHDKRIKRPEKTSYQDDTVRTILINSKGIDVNYEKSICGAFTEVIAEENGLMETGSWLSYTTKFYKLDPKYIGNEAGRRAVSMLGGKQINSGNAPVILTPYVSSIILSMLSPALSAEYVQKGKSLFASAEGKHVASNKFTLFDSGTYPEGLATIPYDDEGTPTKETPIVQNGIFSGYLYDQKSANKAKKASTGNALRGSFMSQPDIMPTNLYVRPGRKTREEMIGGVTKGFLVETIMGAHTINPISGEFSIGFSGQYIENGKISRPVRGMTIAGNLLNLLTRIDEVGTDLLFFPLRGNIGSPSILISHLSVSGI